MGTSNVLVYPNILGNKHHPTEKPIMLMEDLIVNSTNEGDKVLDPFCGSGSTLLACKQTNREYYGIEIDEKYYNIAKKRLESEFVSREKKSEQITLF
jgi:site-specific DNA-methyltransferase (adenine-specific)